VEATRDYTTARVYARSAVAMGVAWIGAHPNWQENINNAKTNAHLKDGVVSLQFQYPESYSPAAYTHTGKISDARNAKRIFISGVGRQGDAQYRIRVRQTQDTNVGLSCLEAAIYAKGSFHVDSDATINS